MPRYNNSEIAHVWISGNKTSGEANSMSFNEGSFFSYGTMIAAKRTKNNETVVFVDTSSYSVTTSSHQSKVFIAANHLLTVGYCVQDAQADAELREYDSTPNVVNDIVINKLLRKQIDSLLEKAVRSRKYSDSYIEQAIEVALKLNKVLDWFGSSLERYDTSIECFRGASLEDIKTRLAEEKRLAREKQKEQLEQWLSGKTNTVPSEYKDTALLRVYPHDPTVVETTLGVRFPLRACELLYKLWQKGEVIKGVDAARISIGHYKLTLLDPNWGIKAGCHFISPKEVERFAEVIGLKKNEKELLKAS